MYVLLFHTPSHVWPEFNKLLSIVYCLLMDVNGIADLVIIVNTYLVEGLYINDKTLDVSTTLDLQRV